MQINGNAGYNPIMLAHGQKARNASAADFAATQQALEEGLDGGMEPGGPAGPDGPFQMRRGAPPVDPNTILAHWGTSDAVADLNTDGIVDAQDLAMALGAAQDAPPAGGGSNDSSDEWTNLTGGDLNGDGVVDAVDLAMKLNAQSDGSNDSEDAWTNLTGGDLNGDGVVDAVDLAMKLNGDGGGTSDNRRMSLPEGDAGADLLATPVNMEREVDAVLAETKPERMIERLSNLIVKKFDGDGDGAISQSDLPEGSKVLERFDRDASGVLDQSELTAGLRLEFDRYREASGSTNAGPFVKRWLETFSGMRPFPDYVTPMRLQDLFMGPENANRGGSTPGILSAKA